MYCQKCGNEIPDNSVFCDVCGERVSLQVGTQQTVQKDVKKKEEKQIYHYIVCVFVSFLDRMRSAWIYRS